MTLAQDDARVSEREGPVDELLDEQDGDAVPLGLLDALEDLVDDDRGETRATSRRQRSPWARTARARAMGQHLLLTAGQASGAK